VEELVAYTGKYKILVAISEKYLGADGVMRRI